MKQYKFEPVTPYEKYCEKSKDERCELLNGEIIRMETRPLEEIEICQALLYQLYGHLLGKQANVYLEGSVRLQEDEPINNVFRPDIMVVCDPSKIRKDSVVGVPDLIIEVILPYEKAMIADEKQRILMEAGVCEYWVINPESHTIITYVQDEAHVIHVSFPRGDRIPVTVLDDFAIDMTTVFPPIPTEEEPSGEN
ncbi:hypothetical protein FACS1894184_06870 [Clostridia bacterium]|nr:hypothetical protein FACS1894184_06870 [Clostridia bacterium]